MHGHSRLRKYRSLPDRLSPEGISAIRWKQRRGYELPHEDWPWGGVVQFPEEESEEEEFDFPF